MDEITETSCSVVFEQIGRRAYVNTIRGRTELFNDCKKYARLDLYTQILAVWGDVSPSNEDIEPKQTFDEQKINKLYELENSFMVRTHGVITTTQGFFMQFSPSDSLKMQGAITLMEAVGSTFGYITQANDETVYNVSIETMKQVLIEMLNAYAKCHARKQELRTLINNAQTATELAEIAISWPV